MDKRLVRLITVIVILTGLAFWTCQSEKDATLYVAVAKYKDTENFAAYKAWLQGVDSNIVLVDMYHLPQDSALLMLSKCSGLLMNGGADVHPGYYDQPQDTVICEIDGQRDTLEMLLLARAKEMGLPVFGICRGLQVLNVFYGGSLYPDIPSRLGTVVMHRNEDRSYENFHQVALVAGSRIQQLTGKTVNEVNSVHHQGIEALAPGLRGTAYAPDSLIEAIEWDDTTHKAFLMAVQWHPERLGLDHPLSGPLAKHFVEAARAYQKSATGK